MKLQKLAGATSEIWQVFIRDSSSTTGGGLTGLVFNSASLTAYYHRDTDTTATAITLVTMTVGTFTSSGFKEIDATNMPGWYQFCPPNAALAASAKSCAFHLKGATNMAPLPIEVQLTVVNHDSAAFGLSIAKTTNITGFNDIAAPTGFAAATFPAGTVANTTNITAGTITTTTNLTNLPAITANWLTAAGIAAGALDGKGNWNIGKTGYALTATTGLGNQTADITGSLSGSVGSVTGAVGSVTGNVGGNVAGSVGSVTGAVGSVTGAVGSVTGAVGSVTGNVGGNVAGSVASVTAAVAITSNVKKNQALARFEFMMTDATTHAPLTGATVTVTRSIDGAAFGAGTLSAVTEVSNGIYYVDFGSGDLNGNVITLRATAAGADDTFSTVVTQP